MLDSQLMRSSARNKHFQERLHLSDEDVRKKVKQRLTAARLLNEWTQTEAAERLGYKNSTQVSLWEKAGDRMPPPMQMLRIAQVYRVSLDYLWGLSESPERDPQAAHQYYLMDAQKEISSQLMRDITDLMQAIAKTGGPTVECSLLITGEGERAVAAFKRFLELNREGFEDMRGGAALLSAMDSLEHNGVTVAKEQIRRFKTLGTASVRSTLKRISSPQISSPLFDQTSA